MSNRNAEFESHQHAKRVSRRVRQIEAVDFFNLLTGPALLEMTDSYLPEYREWLYPPTVTLSMFMMQALNEDGSCQDIAVLFTLIAQVRVGNRPGRIEPRARKRRPKPYPWLKVPRAQARAQIAAHGHP